MAQRTEAYATDRAVPEIARSAIRALLYFDIFKYPLRAEEVARVCDHPGVTADEVRECLRSLHARGLLKSRDGYYFTGEAPDYLPRRLRGNALAEKRLVKARKVSRFIGRFPFVRAVMVSGSLSKNYMEPDSDIDYFVVTEPGRLWIARTMLILYKKIFLLNSHRNFCVNYFIDTDHLEIEDRNAFTATEVVYLLPTYNAELYREFRLKNDWAKEYYPNFGLRDTGECHAPNRNLLRRGVEWLLGGRTGEWLDTVCMKRTLKRWRTKFSGFDKRKFEVTLRTRKYVSKHHPSDYQAVVIDKLRKKKEWYRNVYGPEV